MKRLCWFLIVAVLCGRSWTSAAAQEMTEHWQNVPAHAETDEYSVGSCLNACGPRPAALQFTADLLILDRDHPDASPLFFDTNTSAVLFDTGDLIRSAEAGVRLGLILFEEEGSDLEFSYLGLDDYGGEFTRSSNDPIIFPFFGGVPANPTNSYTAFYESMLHSGEVNLRRHWTSRFTALAGLRFVELKENFDVRSGNGVFSSGTDNDLYGFQIGADWQIAHIRRSILFTTLKSGVFYNNANVSALANSGNQPIQFNDDEDEVAYVGDVALGMLIPMGSHADFRIGYQGLYLTGVGLAPDQSDDYSLFTSAGTLDQSTVLYHGGFLGIDLFW